MLMDTTIGTLEAIQAGLSARKNFYVLSGEANYGCRGNCEGDCAGSCEGDCAGNCEGDCAFGCSDGCTSSNF